MAAAKTIGQNIRTLNESPSEKEGKFPRSVWVAWSWSPSMKVPPKRKGNTLAAGTDYGADRPSMKVPPKRKGNRINSGSSIR